MISPRPYRTIARIRKPRNLGSDDPGNDPGRPKNEGSDDAEASDKKDAEASDVNKAEDDDSDNSDQSVGTDTSDNSRHKMARSKPKTQKPPPSDREVEAWAAEEQLKQDEAVKWYEDVLGFPEPSATALYIPTDPQETT